MYTGMKTGHTTNRLINKKSGFHSSRQRREIKVILYDMHWKEQRKSSRPGVAPQHGATGRWALTTKPGVAEKD